MSNDWPVSVAAKILDPVYFTSAEQAAATWKAARTPKPGNVLTAHARISGRRPLTDGEAMIVNGLWAVPGIRSDMSIDEYTVMGDTAAFGINEAEVPTIQTICVKYRAQVSAEIQVLMALKGWA